MSLPYQHSPAPPLLSLHQSALCFAPLEPLSVLSLLFHLQSAPPAALAGYLFGHCLSLFSVPKHLFPSLSLWFAPDSLYFALHLLYWSLGRSPAVFPAPAFVFLILRLPFPFLPVDVLLLHPTHHLTVLK